MFRRMEPFCTELRIRELGFFSLEKRRFLGDLTVAFQYLKGAYKEDGEGLFSQGPGVTGQGRRALSWNRVGLD